MLIDWLCYIVIGFFSGLSQLLPVSASASEQLLVMLLDAPDYGSFLQSFVHIGCIAAVLVRFGKRLGHIYRERRLALLPARRRKRQPDLAAVLDGRLLSGTLIPMAAVLVVSWFYRELLQGLPVMIAMLVLTGLFAYLPAYFPGGNRDSRGLTRLDSWLLGLCAGLSHIPGLSGLTAVLCAGQLRGCGRQYILDLALLLMLPALGIMTILDGAALVASGFAGLSVGVVFGGLLAGAAAFGGALAAISLVRHLAVRSGFSGFAFYSWGMAMFYFMLYLLT